MSSNESAGGESQFTLTVEKKRTTETDMTNAQSANLQSYPNKKNILYTTQGIVNSTHTGPAIPIIRQWIKIPKGKQRFGLGDQFMVNLNSGGGSLQTCGIFIYKEYN